MLKLLIMKMFFTSISKFHSSLYLSAAFQVNVGLFSAGPAVLGTTCTVLAVSTGLYTSLTTIIAALAASMAAL